MVTSEVQRDDGDIERTYGRLPLSTKANIIQDVYVTRKKAVTCGRQPSTKSERHKTKEKVRGPLVGPGSDRRCHTCGSSASSPHGTTGNSTSISRSSIRQNKATRTQVAQRSLTGITTSNTERYVQIKPKLRRIAQPTQDQYTIEAVQDLDPHQHHAQVPAHPLVEDLSVQSRSEQPVRNISEEAVPTDGLMDSEQLSSAFQQPGMSRRDSNSFVFQPSLSDLRGLPSPSAMSAARVIANGTPDHMAIRSPGPSTKLLQLS